jgi:DNA-binding response OmpR family regulator
MSAESLRVLYVGNAMIGYALKDCVEPLGWYVYQPESLIEALGVYITCAPHLVIVETITHGGFGPEVYEHVRSLDQVPVIMLGKTQERVDDHTYLLPAGSPLSKIVITAQELVEAYQCSGRRS